MTLKRQIVFGLVCLGIGVILLVVSAFMQAEGPWSGFATGFLAVGAAKLLRAGRLGKDPEKAADYEAAMKDERTMLIVRKARSTILYYSIFLELLIGLVAIYVFDQKLLGGVMMGLVCLQTFSFTVLYWYYNKNT